MAHAILLHLDGVQADVVQVTGLVHRWLKEVDERLPVLRILERGLTHEVLQQLAQQNATDSSKQLKEAAAEVWAQLQAGASQHLSSLLSAHNLLVAVSDMCRQAANALILVHTKTQPLLLSSGRELVTSFMQLLCATTRMALLLDELPRRLLAVMLHICHQLASDAAATSHSAEGGSSGSVEAPGPLPNTDLPIYHAPSMVQMLQQVMLPVTPRVEQIMELSVAPAMLALFPGSPITVPGPQNSKSNHKKTAKNSLPSGYQQLPPIFFVQGSTGNIELETAGISSTGSVSYPAWMPMHMRAQLNQAAGATSKYMRMGPGGFTIQVAQQLCLQYGQLKEWVLLGYLACPAALLHADAVTLLAQSLMSEVRLQLWEERCCWVGLLHIQSLAALTAPPQYGARITHGGAAPTSDVLHAVRRHVRDNKQDHILSDARATVQRAVQTSLRDAAAWQRLLHGQCIQQLQRVTAACQAEPKLLSSNLLMLLALLTISRYSVSWHFRHVGTWQQLPAQLRQLAPHAASSTSSSLQPGGIAATRPSHVVSNGTTTAVQQSGRHSDAGAARLGSFSSAPLPPVPRPAANTNARHASLPVRPGGLMAAQSCHVMPKVSDAAVAAAAAAVSLPVGGRAASGASLPAQRTERLFAGVMAAFGRTAPTAASHPEPPPPASVIETAPMITEPLSQEECEELLGVLQLLGAMQDLTELLVRHTKDVREQMREVVSLSMQRHIIPGRVRLDASKLTASGLATTQHDVQLLVGLIERALALPTSTSDDERQHVGLSAALAHTWRTMQLHTLLLPKEDSPGKEDDNSTQAVDPASSGAASKDTGYTNGTWASSEANADLRSPAAEQQQTEGDAAAQADAAPGMWAGLAAAQVAAITHDPLFLLTFQQAAQHLEWMLCPGSMLSSYAGLHVLAHYPQHMTRCVAAALMQPHTSYLALGALRSLRWMDQQEHKSTSDSNADSSSDAQASRTPGSVAGTAADLANHIMSRITDRLSSSLAPLLRHVTPCHTQLKRPMACLQPGALQCGNMRPGSSPHLQTLQMPMHEAMAGSTASAIMPLCVAMATAGQVKITAQMSVVPLEYLREVLRDSVMHLLTQMAVEVPNTDAGSRLQDGSWRPTAALSRVQQLLEVAATLQPLLGVQLQQELIQLLYCCTATAIKQEGGDTMQTAPSTPCRPVMAYLEAVASWCARCVLQDAEQQCCVYSPMLSAFLCGGAALDTNPTSNKAGADTRTRRGMAASSDGNDVQRSSINHAAAAAASSSKLKKFKKKLRGVAGTALNASDSNNRKEAIMAHATAGSRASDIAGTVDVISGVDRQPWHQQSVLLSLPEVISLLQLCGPQAACVLLSSCTHIMQQCLQELDAQLLVRQPALSQLQTELASTAQDVNSWGWGTSTEQAALQEHVATLLGSVRGHFTARENSKVQANLAVLARCVALRQMVSEAMQQAAQRHTAAWVTAMKHLAVPAWLQGPVAQAKTAATPDSRDAAATAADTAHENGLRDINDEEYWSLDVDWEQCVVSVDDTEDRDTGDAALRDCQATCGAAKTAAMSGKQSADRVYTDMWQLPRAAGQHSVPSSEDGQRPYAVQADPLLVQLLSGMVQNPQCCERWVLLPLLLGLCMPSPGAAPSRLGVPIPATRATPQASLLQQQAEALQLCTSVHDAYLRTLRALTAAWQAAITQVLQSPASLEHVLPHWYQAEAQYQRVTALAAAARHTGGAAQQQQQHLQDLQTDVRDTACKGARNWLTQNMADWGHAFQRAATGV